MTAKSKCDKCGGPIEYDEKAEKWKAEELELLKLDIAKLKKGTMLMINGNETLIAKVGMEEERSLIDDDFNHIISGRLVVEFSRKAQD